MKLALVLGLAVGAIASSVYGADMPQRYAAPVYARPIVWDGSYAGLHAGYAWNGKYTDTYNYGGIASYVDSVDMKGAMFGGVFGHDWTRGQLLFGFVTDYQWSSVQGSVTDQYGFGASRTLTSKLKDFGTTRGRVGVTYGRWLGYATGGLAYGRVSVSDCYRDPFFSSCTTNDSFGFGHSYGAGIEAFVFDGVTAKLEYLKVVMPVTHTSSTPYPYDRKTRFDTDFWRFGINYRF